MIRRVAVLLALGALVVVGSATGAAAQLGGLTDEVEPPGGAEPAYHWECSADEDLPEPVFRTILNEAELAQRLVELEAGQQLPVDISEELAEQMGCTAREEQTTGFSFEEEADEISGELSGDTAVSPIGTEDGAILPVTGLGSALGLLAGLGLMGSALGLRRVLRTGAA